MLWLSRKFVFRLGFFVFLAASLFCFGMSGARASGLPPMNLTIVGLNKTDVLLLNETSIASLPVSSGYGCYVNQIGVLKQYGNYSGMSLQTLCSLVGRLTNTSIVKVTASDNYTMNFTDAEVMGDFAAFDNATAQPVNHTEPLVPIVAYYYNGSNVPSGDGPLRLAIVSSQGYATISSFWVKMVIRVEVIETAVPEYPSPMFISAFLLVSSAIILSLTYRKRRISVDQRRELLLFD